MPKLYTSKAWLTLQLKTKSAKQIAKECKVNESTINRQIKSLGIK